MTTADDLYAAIGFGEIQPTGVVNILTEEIREKAEAARKKEAERAILEDHQELEQKDKQTKQTEKKKAEEGVLIEGIDNMLVRLSHCCSPIPGDEIVGYITKGRGVSVHRVDCPNIKSDDEANRLISVTWNVIPDNRKFYDADLEVAGYNRSGLLNDIIMTISNNTKNMSSINGRVDHNKMAIITATVGIKDLEHLERVMDAIKRIPDVYTVKRTIH